jgi:DNA-binding protein H-NS
MDIQMTESDIAKQVTEWLDDVALEVGSEDQFRSCLRKIGPYIDTFKDKPDDDFFDAITSSGTWLEQKLTNTELTNAHSTNIDTIHKAFVFYVHSRLGEKTSGAKFGRDYDIEYDDTDIKELQEIIASSYDGLFDKPHVPMKERKYVLGRRGKFIKRKKIRPPTQRRLTREQWIAEDYSMSDDVRDLEKQIEALNKRLEHVKGISKAKERVDAFIEETGYTFEDLYGNPKATKTRKPRKPNAPAIYQHPDDKRKKWSGPPAKMPDWLKEFKESGFDIEDYRVKPE